LVVPCPSGNSRLQNRLLRRKLVAQPQLSSGEWCLLAAGSFFGSLARCPSEEVSGLVCTHGHKQVTSLSHTEHAAPRRTPAGVLREMIKSALLRFPWLFERVQRFRDSRFFKTALLAGSFSQHGEDKQILKALVKAGERGPFLDVGCNHPFRLSNSYLLYKHGWRGVCVDPLPRYGSLFAQWRPEDTFVNAAVGTTTGSHTLFEFDADVLSTLDNGVAERYIKAGYRLRRTRSVQTKRIDDVLEQAGIAGPLSFVSLDIEGNELDALRSMDLSRWRPRMICVEVKNVDGLVSRAAVDFLCERGYEELAFNELNVILRR